MKLEQLWYDRRPVVLLLWPAALLFCSVARLRRRLYRWRWLPVRDLPVPVIVVGNLTAGGTGKTPLVAWLARYLQERGYRPGLIARGYRGRAQSWPQQVRADSDPRSVGDEPILLARRTACPMAVGPDRAAAGEAVLAHTDCDILLSDDGLQHYGLGRDIEILVVDGVRRFGNGMCLPAGPLREPLRRRNDLDLILCNGVPRSGELGMQIRMTAAVNVHDPKERRALEDFRGEKVAAVAGIGYPQRFFDALKNKGLDLDCHAFPDHHDFTAQDLAGIPASMPVLMTEKDAVKCQRLARANLWYVDTDIDMDPRFAARFDALLKALPRTGQKDALSGPGPVR